MADGSKQEDTCSEEETVARREAALSRILAEHEPVENPV